MQRCFLALLFFTLTGAAGLPAGSARASLPDTLATMQTAVRPDSVIADSTAADSLDTRSETRKERRARERKQEEPETVPEIFKDSARLAIEAKTRQAWRRSMIIPGWGQISNGGLWWIKVPVIYGGFISTGLIFEFNNRHYQAVLKEVQYRVSNNHAFPPNSEYDYIGADSQGTEFLISWKDYHRRIRDISILATAGWYALNIIEAYVDSMLKNRWEIGEDLTFRVTPTILPASSNPLAYNTPVFGFNIKLNLH